MLRVLIFDEPTTLKIRLEGLLNESTLPEFHRALDTAEAAQGGRMVLLDVAGLVLDGAAAETALIQARPAGAKIVDANGRIAELIEEQEQRECSQRCNFFARIAFALASLCHSSSRLFCTKVYRLLQSRS